MGDRLATAWPGSLQATLREGASLWLPGAEVSMETDSPRTTFSFVILSVFGLHVGGGQEDVDGREGQTPITLDRDSPGHTFILRTRRITESISV